MGCRPTSDLHFGEDRPNSAGYQILAASPGIVEHDRRELVAWGPSHDSLPDAGPEAESVNFFPLPSGSFCVSRTTPAGWEYSGRGGHRIYTHCLVASPAVLRQFANHPLEMLDAATARHSLDAAGSHTRMPGAAGTARTGCRSRSQACLPVGG